MGKVGRPRLGKRPMTSTERARKTRVAQMEAIRALKAVDKILNFRDPTTFYCFTPSDEKSWLATWARAARALEGISG